MIVINKEKCSGCSYCVLTCPVGALSSYYTVEVNDKCTGCKICLYNCPNYAILIQNGGNK